MPFSRDEVERPLALVVLRIYVGASVQQEFYDRVMSARDRPVEGRYAFVVRAANGGSGIEETADSFRVAPFRRAMELFDHGLFSRESARYQSSRPQ